MVSVLNLPRFFFKVVWRHLNLIQTHWSQWQYCWFHWKMEWSFIPLAKMRFKFNCSSEYRNICRELQGCLPFFFLALFSVSNYDFLTGKLTKANLLKRKVLSHDLCSWWRPCTVQPSLQFISPIVEAWSRKLRGQLYTVVVLCQVNFLTSLLPFFLVSLL